MIKKFWDEKKLFEDSIKLLMLFIKELHFSFIIIHESYFKFSSHAAFPQFSFPTCYFFLLHLDTPLPFKQLSQLHVVQRAIRLV